MQWLTLKRLLRAERGMRKADLYGQIAAIHKAQAVIEFDLDGHVLMANQNFLDTVGYELDEVIGQHHRIFVLPDERESADYLAFWDRLGQGAHDSGRYRRIRKDGGDVWLQASYNPIFDRHGRPFKVVKFATDITRRFTAAQTLRVAVQGLTENADRAGQANALARDACRVAEEGGRTVAGVVRTMGAITESSKRISEIIGVMDGIAFQTNILALNAAVEAARAGTHGKGFAVVASEVRSLAQNSAAAAKEIKGLITTSVEQIENGAGQVQSAGVTMEDIVASSRRVTEIMAEVVEVSLAQSGKLGEVTEDITHMTADAASVPQAAHELHGGNRVLKPALKPVAPAVRARPAANTPLPAEPVLEYVRY
ncbi:methyl-accepting chemotaxis protein [Achromobacter xylosoxidans]